MSISHLLEKFEPRREGSTTISISDVSLEEEKLQAFERGYGAGWEDAQKSQADGHEKLTSDLANNLRELSFTYHEANSHMAKALKPFLDQVLATVLPDIAKQSLGPQLTELLHEAALKDASAPVEIVVSAANEDTVKNMLQGEFGFELNVVTEASLGDGQAFLRFGEVERQIDYDSVLAGISQAIDAFFHEVALSEQKESDHVG